MYNFHKDIACSDRVIIAKREEQDKKTNNYNLERIDIKHPGIPNKSLAYGMMFDPALRRKVEATIKEYNEHIDFLDALSGFIPIFVENRLMISKEQALTLWPEETVDKIFSLKEYAFETSLHICQNVLYDCNYEQTYSVSVEGHEIAFLIKDHFLKNWHGKKRCIWNWVDDGHDFTLYLWDMLGSRYWQDDSKIDTNTDNLSQCDDDDDDDQVTYHFDCYEQFRFEGNVEIQLIKIFEKLEKLGYLESYTIKPESFDPRWHHFGKSDATIDLALIDESFKKNKLLMEQIELLMWSKPEALEKPFYFLTDKDNKQCLSDKPAQFGGHYKLKIYGRLDCPSANRYVQQGQFVKHRVFFADEETAIAAGYRPCGKCMPEAYKNWKAEKKK